MPTDDSKPTLSERSREFFASINETCLPRIDRATVPILAVQNDEIVHGYTGVLYRIADHHFVLTAAHKLRQIVEANIPLYLSMNKRGVLPIPLAEARFHSTEEEGRDVAAIWIPPETASEVAKHREFLSHNQINFSGAESRGPFAFFGYPGEWSGHVVDEDSILSQGLVFPTFPYNGPQPKSAHFDPAVHMLLHFTRDAMNTLDGSIDKLPEPFGISGCGIWQVGDILEKELKARDESSVKLVGIQHRWSRKSDYIQGTKIAYLLNFILENYPEARAAMNLVYPTLC